ncbi:MAG: FG-GAP repeat protein [Micropruina sp.]
MSRSHRLVAAVLGLGLGLGSTCLAPAEARAAANCAAGQSVAGDLNGDGKADVVVGVPAYDDERGGVDILFSNGERRFLTASDLGLPSGKGDRFGQSVALGDVNDDGCADLAVGAPGRNSSKGAAYLVRSSAANTLTLMNSFAGSTAHGSFGAQVLLLTPQKQTASGLVNAAQQLVVAAPTADDGKKWEAGRVEVLPLTAGFALTGSRTVITQNSPGIPGTSENGDRFGTALAGQGRTIVIGTPNEAVGTRTDAGSVTLLSATAAKPTTFRGVAVTQNSAGVPGTAEADDLFGRAVAFRDNYVLIGAPGERIGSAYFTGQVHVLNFNPATRTYRSLRMVHQDGAGIPGSNRTGDWFGASVALGVNTLDQLTAIVGIPGKSVDKQHNAGAVLMFRANRAGGAVKVFRQGKDGISGKPETGDDFGSAVGVLGGNLNDGEAMRDGVVIGVPSEDIGTTENAGTVVYSRTLSKWSSLVLEDAGPSAPPADTLYGETVANAAAA